MIDRILDYHVLDRVATDDLGALYRARHLISHLSVLIRVLPGELSAGPKRREALAEQISAARATAHPNIAPVIDAGEHDGRLFVVYQQTPGETLRSILETRQLALRAAVDVAIQLAEALAEADAHGLAHPGLSAERVVVTPSGHVTVLDFGLPPSIAGTTSDRETPASAGENGGDAPNPSRDEPQSGFDLASLGALVSELFNSTASVSRTEGGRPQTAGRPASRERRDAVPELADIAERAVASEAERGFGCAAALAAELRSVAAILDVRGAIVEEERQRTIAEERQRRVYPRWRPRLLIGVACLAALSLEPGVETDVGRLKPAPTGRADAGRLKPAPTGRADVGSAFRRTFLTGSDPSPVPLQAVPVPQSSSPGWRYSEGVPQTARSHAIVPAEPTASREAGRLRSAAQHGGAPVRSSRDVDVGDQVAWSTPLRLPVLDERLDLHPVQAGSVSEKWEHAPGRPAQPAEKGHDVRYQDGELSRPASSLGPVKGGAAAGFQDVPLTGGPAVSVLLAEEGGRMAARWVPRRVAFHQGEVPRQEVPRQEVNPVPATVAPALPTGTSDLQGTVTDQTGGVVIGALATLEDREGRKWTLTTDSRGRYSFEDVPAGPYALSVTSEGFATFRAKVELRPRRTTSMNVGLKLGISVEVDVRERPGVSPDPRRNLSAMILTRKDIDALPDDPRLFMRRLLEMAGGAMPGDVAVYVDGFREYKRLPPKDAIEMIRINSNPFSAEFSERSSKRIEIVTKPGSDSFHGDATLRFRDSSFDARNPIAPIKPRMQHRDYNGYLQGPIRKGRAGFLVYGGQWQQDENAIVHATVLDTVAGLAQAFATTVTTPIRVASAFVKGDFEVFKQLINVSYSRTDERHLSQGLDGGFDLPERAYDLSSNDDTGRLWWTSIIGGSAVHDLRVELTRSFSAATPRSTAPAIEVLEAFNAGGNQGGSFQKSSVRVQATDSFTIQHGSHMSKAGIQLETIRQEDVDRSGFAGSFVFGSDVERDLFGRPVVNAVGQPIPISPIEHYRRTVLGLPGYGPSQFSISRGNPEVDVSQWQLGWFVLDDWSISKVLSLSYGVRQELQNNLKRRWNIAPRAALSWVLNEQGTSAVKAGAGIFHERVDPGITFDTRRLDGTRQLQLVVPNPPFFTTIPSSLDAAFAENSTVYTKSADLREPHSLIASLSYERDLRWGLSGVVEYLFNKGANLLRLRNIAAPAPDTADTPNASSAPAVYQYESTGRSSHHELLLGLRGSIGSQVTMYANYTLARRYSDTDGASSLPANSSTLAGEYGPSSGDQRHELATGATLDFPGGLIVSPYLTIASGRPFDITTGRDNNRDTVFNDRPAFAEPGDPGAISTPFGHFNPNPQPGDRIIPRNFGRDPHQVTVNLHVSKSLPRGLTLTIDVENPLNKSRMTGANGVVTSPTFGIPNLALNARRFGLGIRYGF